LDWKLEGFEYVDSFSKWRCGLHTGIRWKRPCVR